MLLANAAHTRRNRIMPHGATEPSTPEPLHDAGSEHVPGLGGVPMS